MRSSRIRPLSGALMLCACAAVLAPQAAPAETIELRVVCVVGYHGEPASLGLWAFEPRAPLTGIDMTIALASTRRHDVPAAMRSLERIEPSALEVFLPMNAPKTGLRGGVYSASPTPLVVSGRTGTANGGRTWLLETIGAAPASSCAAKRHVEDEDA